MVIELIYILHGMQIQKYGELHIAGAGGGYDTGNDLLAVSQCNVIALDANASDVSRFEGRIIEIS